MNIILTILILSGLWLLYTEIHQSEVELTKLASMNTSTQLVLSGGLFIFFIVLFVYLFITVILNYKDFYSFMGISIQNNLFLLIFSLVGASLFSLYLYRTWCVWWI